MIIFKIILNIILVFLILLLTVLLASYITGRDKRSYTSLQPFDTLNIAGQTSTIDSFAQIYKPEMFLRPNTPTPPLKWIWYEAVPSDTTIDFTYYFAWENEINPNKAIHNLYSIFRSAYYGYPLYDIEYFQINIDKSSGLIKRLRFETSKTDDYFPTIVDHILIAIERADNGNYLKYKIDPSGNHTTPKELIDLHFDNKRVKAGVQTWNHLTRLLDSNAISDYSILQDKPLKFLTDSDYKQYKFVRKSQGDHKTKENKITFYIALFLSFLCVSIPSYFIRRRAKSKSNKA